MAMNDHQHDDSSTFLSTSNARRPSRHRRERSDSSSSSSTASCCDQQDGFEDNSSNSNQSISGSSTSFSDNLSHSQNVRLGGEVNIPGTPSASSRQSSSGKNNALAELSSEEGTQNKGEIQREEDENNNNNNNRGPHCSESPSRHTVTFRIESPEEDTVTTATATSDLDALKDLLRYNTSIGSAPPRAPRRDRSRSPRRERSKSPFRRTRSTPDTSPSRQTNPNGETIRNFVVNHDDNDDLHRDMSGSTVSNNNNNCLSPKRSLSPMLRSRTGDAVVPSATLMNRKVEGTITKADLSPRIPLNRRPVAGSGGGATTTRSLRDLSPSPRMPINLQNRGRSLGSVPVSASSKKLRTEALLNSRSPSTEGDDRCAPLLQQRPGLSRGPAKGGLLSRRSSFRNLMGGGGGSHHHDKDRDSHLGGRSLSRRGSFRNLMSESNAMVGRGIRATKSVADLAAMRKTIAVATSSSKSAPAEVEPDPLFMDMLRWNPTSADDRSKFDDAEVRRIIKRHPEALRAKYNVQVGRSTVRRSPLSTMVALGASLETIRAAIKAYPGALKPTGTLRATPLHSACSFNTNMVVVKYIYHKYPEAIKKTTKHVFLPLHNACQMSSPSLEMIQFLVESYPDGLTEINKLGDTPLRTAKRNSTTSAEVLEYLEEETERVFSQNAENEIKRKEVMMRQMWGASSEPLKQQDDGGASSSTALQQSPQHHQGLDDTDHTTISTAQMDQSEHSTSEEFSSEFVQSHSMPFLAL